MKKRDVARVVLVGDPDQLPSVGAGNVFRELIDCGMIPVTVLDQIFRQSKDSLIAYNAKFINEGNTKLYFGPDFIFMASDNQAEAAERIIARYCREIAESGIDRVQILSPFRSEGGERAEFEFAAQHTEMHKFDFTGLAELTEQLCATKEPVYLTIDLDCLDPSCFPGTGTPEAGGVSFLQLLDAIRTVSKANIVGADLNELAPMLDISGVSTATACKVLRELLIALDKGWPGFQV